MSMSVHVLWQRGAGVELMCFLAHLDSRVRIALAQAQSTKHAQHLGVFGVLLQQGLKQRVGAIEASLAQV